MRAIAEPSVLLSATRSTRRPLTLVLGLGTGLLLSVAGPSSAATPALGYKGQAWGSFAVTSTTVVAGQTAVSLMGCRAVAGAHQENTVGSAEGGSLFSTGAVNTSIDALASPTATRSVAEVHSLNLLGGVVTADEVKAQSTTSLGDTGVQLSAAGSGLVKLKVAGAAIKAVPLPNTRIDIRGVGYVILNEQIANVEEDRAVFSVNMIHLVVTAPGPHLETEIIVAHAKSGLQLRAGPLSGFAYATSVNVGDIDESGPSALVTLPCPGTDGAVLTNSVEEVAVPSMFTLGQGVTTARGTVTSTLTRGKTTATVQAVNVAGGLITADLVKAVVLVQTDGTTPTFSDQGTRFLNLRINGVPFGDEVAPNTQVRITGVGTLWLRRTIQLANTMEIAMIELIVFGGADIRVAVANVSVE